MVKSILLRDASGRFVMACVPGASRVDPKAVQAALGDGWRRLHFASGDEILAVTGCVQGAVSPIGLADGVPALFDEAMGRLARCNISSGDPLCGSIGRRRSDPRGRWPVSENRSVVLGNYRCLSVQSLSGNPG